MATFKFDPINGLNDNVFFVTSPNSEAAARSQFMVLFNQIRDYLNSSTLDAGTLAGKKASDFLLPETANNTYAKINHSHSGYAASSHSHDYAASSHSHDYAASSHSHNAEQCGFSWGTGNPNNSDGRPNGSIYYKIEG